MAMRCAAGSNTDFRYASADERAPAGTQPSVRAGLRSVWARAPAAILLEIARRHLHLRDLARRTKVDAHRAWDMVEHLLHVRTPTKRDQAGGRKCVRLDKSSPFLLPLKTPLLRIAHEPSVAAKPQPR
jgi:hypothetical protein